MSDEPGLPRPGDVVGGKYRVECAIGAGGMGAVYRATQLRTGKLVALKWLRPKLAAEPQASQRFVREARASARVRHPNVVDIYDVELEDGQPFLVLELLEGETLRSVLRQRRLGIDESLALLLPAMRGVAAAHSQGVIHRDIKPDNLFITRDPDQPSRSIPKVLDFGISKLAADHPLAEGTLTATGATLGTPHYMSLEQLQGVEADARSDIYAFGVVLYECFTGKRPFESDNFSAIVVKVATETPVDPVTLRPELPIALRDVTLKAMARKPEDRYPSLTALIAALSRLPQEPSLQVATPAPAPAAAEAPDDPTRTSARERSLVPRGAGSRVRGWLVALVVIALSGGVWWLRRTPRADSQAQPGRAPTTAGTAQAEPLPAIPTVKPPAATNATAPPPQSAPAPALGTDTAPSTRTAKSSKFTSGWVYLGDFDSGRWLTRYFDGWGNGLPSAGTKITARGRSNVRLAMPNALGALAGMRTIIGADNAVEVLELARWQGGGYVWARVRAAW